MKINLKCMFLGAHSGTRENGEIYYYGSFLESESNKPLNLYFTNMNYLKTLELRKDYSIPCDFYMTSVYNNRNQKVNVWKIKVLESELK